MNRQQLIEISARAADAFASGGELDESGLAGSRFQIVIPFGCPGTPPSAISDEAPDGLARWRWGEGNRSLRLAATAAEWIDAPEVQAALTQTAGAAAALASPTAPASAETVESAAGFWVSRPWQTATDCPALRIAPPVTETAPDTGQDAEEAEPETGSIRVAPLAPEASPQTLGLVQLFTDQSPRTGRTVGRPHVHTIRAEGDAPLAAPDKGFRLVLEGRIARFPNGRSISCAAPGPDVRPRCLVAVTFDRIALRDPVSQNALAEWR